MKDIFHEAATQVDNAAIRKWKADGKKVIGHVCSHVPEEIATAAGMMPYRLRGIGTTSTSIGDTYFGPFICSCPKAILQNAGRGRFNFLDGAIMVQACDSMRRLDECWRKAGEDYGQIVPSFFYYFGVPHKTAEYSIKWFAEEIEKYKKAVEDHFSVTITEESLWKAIELHNETRRLQMELEALRALDKPPLSGIEAMSITLAGTAMPKAGYNTLLAETVEELKAKDTDEHAGRIRILLGGSVVDDLSLIAAIEAEGAVVVADTVCFGARAYARPVETEESVYMTLARHYLNEQFCPRMFGYARQRFALLKERLETAKADGVVFQNIRFCDLHGSENGLFERDLDEMGIPSTRIEREYGAGTDEGRIRMRVGAFLETVEKVKRKKERSAA